MERRYHFVYQTKNLVNSKTYIGIHKTDNLNDGYLGCGVYINDISKKKTHFQRAIHKHGKENFKLEILCFCDNWEECKEEEAWLVTEDWVKSRDNYNISLGGQCPIFSEEHFNFISKDIYQFDLYGCLIKKWSSTTQIVNQTGYCRKVIANCCKYNRGQYKGCQWSFSPVCGLFNNNKQYKNVYQYDLKDNFVTVFLNPKEASMKTGLNSKSIAACANGARETCGNFKWFYHNINN